MFWSKPRNWASLARRFRPVPWTKSRLSISNRFWRPSRPRRHHHPLRLQRLLRHPKSYRRLSRRQRPSPPLSSPNRPLPNRFRPSQHRRLWNRPLSSLPNLPPPNRLPNRPRPLPSHPFRLLLPNRFLFPRQSRHPLLQPPPFQPRHHHPSPSLFQRLRQRSSRLPNRPHPLPLRHPLQPRKSGKRSDSSNCPPGLVLRKNPPHRNPRRAAPATGETTAQGRMPAAAKAAPDFRPADRDSNLEDLDSIPAVPARCLRVAIVIAVRASSPNSAARLLPPGLPTASKPPLMAN